MKLYAHNMSTTSRPILMFCQEQDVGIELMPIDLLSGEHKQDSFKRINPNGMVPVLEDDGFVLTESSAILKYLAEKVGSPTYPKELTLRARINEIMDWVNTQFYREIAFHVNYQKSSQTKHGLARKKIRASLTGVSKGWFPSSKYLTVGGTC